MQIKTYPWTHYYKLYVYPFIDETDFHGIIDNIGMPAFNIEKMISILIIGGALHKEWEQLAYLPLENEEIRECLSLTKNQASLFNLPYMERFFEKIQHSVSAKTAFINILERFVNQCKPFFPETSSNPEELYNYLKLNYQYSLFKTALEHFFQELHYKKPELYKQAATHVLSESNFNSINQIAVDSLFAEIKWIVNHKSLGKDYQEINSFLELRKIYVKFARARSINFIKNQLFVKKFLEKPKVKPKESEAEILQNPKKEITTGTTVLVISIFLAIIHIFILGTIAFQPLSINSTPPEKHFLLWPFYNDAVHHDGPGNYFFGLYNAGKTIEADEDIYGQKNLNDIPFYAENFRGLPVFAQTLGRLFALPGPRQAYQLWVIFTEILLLSLLTLIWFRTQKWWVRLEAALFLFFSTPFFLEVHVGQFSFVAIALLSIALLLPKETKRWFPASIQQIAASLILSLGFMVNLVSIISLPALIKRKRYWPGLILGIFLLLVLNIPYFLSHPQSWEAFTAPNQENFLANMKFGNFSFLYLIYIFGENMAWTNFLQDFASFGSSWQIIVIIFTSLAVLFARYKRPSLGVSLMILAYFVSSPVLYEHHFSAIVITGLLILMAVSNEKKSGSRLIYLITTIACLSLIILPTLFVVMDAAKDITITDPSIQWEFWQKSIFILPKIIGTLGLYLIALMKLTSMGLKLPWQEYRKNLQPREHGIL